MKVHRQKVFSRDINVLRQLVSAQLGSILSFARANQVNVLMPFQLNPSCLIFILYMLHIIIHIIFVYALLYSNGAHA